MWILPNTKNLRTLASARGTEALISDSQELSDLLEQSVLSRSKPSPSRTWCRRLKTTSWMKHLSGAILKPSHGQAFVEKWTSSVEGFLVNHSQEPGESLAMKTQDTCGPTSSKASEDLTTLPLFSLKMLRESSALSSNPMDGQTQKEQVFCNMSSESWSDWVTEQRQAYSARAKSAHLIKENVSSFWGYTPNSTHSEDLIFPSNYLKKQGLMWRTPMTADDRASRNTDPKKIKAMHSRGRQVLLAHQAVLEQSDLTEGADWRTPMTADVNGSTYADVEKIKALHSNGKQVLLAHQVYIEQDKLGQVEEAVISSIGNHPEHTIAHLSWSTPTARDWKGAEGRAYKGETQDLPAQTEGLAKAKVGKLNPRWVETLMGLPIGWVSPSCAQPWIIEQTSYDLLETESFPNQQSELSATCGRNWNTPMASQRGDNLAFYLKRCLEQVRDGKEVFSAMLQVQTEADERGIDIEECLRAYDGSSDIESYISSVLSKTV